MLFNSLHFLLFFPAVCALYFAIRPRWRWLLLLAASYYFYASWKPGYLALIVASTLVDYVAARRMSTIEDRSRRKPYLFASIFVNLGLLFTFKYYDFFANSLESAVDASGYFMQLPDLELLLPVGISFYTFQTLSYAIDVYRGDQEPERHLGRFALFVAFFPQLVAGPIERASRLLPQFRDLSAKWDSSRAHEGFQLMLRGFIKKTCIADRVAPYVDMVYANPSAFSTPWLIAATYMFAVQIYCDFSGYSDIAIGSARVMGIRLSDNFRRPYFANSFGDFWHRWHISLSTFFRDYVYIPLGGNRRGEARTLGNVFATFVISGLWHGANWTFVVWGALHGLYLCVEKAVGDRLKLDWRSPIAQVGKVLFVFHMVLVAWVFFRAGTVTEAFEIVGRTFALLPTPETVTNPVMLPGVWWYFVPQAMQFDFIVLTFMIGGLAAYEYQRERGETLRPKPYLLRWASYGVGIALLLVVGKWGAAEFIYFQF